MSGRANVNPTGSVSISAIHANSGTISGFSSSVMNSISASVNGTKPQFFSQALIKNLTKSSALLAEVLKICRTKRNRQPRFQTHCEPSQMSAAFDGSANHHGVPIFRFGEPASPRSTRGNRLDCARSGWSVEIGSHRSTNRRRNSWNNRSGHHFSSAFVAKPTGRSVKKRSRYA